MPDSHSTLSFFTLPRPKGKVLDFETAPDTITIVRTSDFNHYVEPPSEPGSIRKDLVVTGFVIVHMSKPCRARKLSVRFLAEVTLAYPGRRWEDDVIYERTLEMDGTDEDGIALSAGQQFFEFTFVLPPTLAGRDRTPYGRVSHRVQATLCGQSPAASRIGSFFTSFRTRSTSPKLSPGSDVAKCTPPLRSPTASSRPVVSERSGSFDWTGSNSTHTFPYNPSPVQGDHKNSPDERSVEPSTQHLVNSLPLLEGDLTVSKDLWVIALATRDNGALPLNLHQRTEVSGLGKLNWGLASNAVCVGGLVQFWCIIKNTDPAATIWSVRLSINQTFAVKSPRRIEEPETVFPPTELVIFKTGTLLRNQAERYVLPHNRSVFSGRRDSSKDPLWEGELVPRPEASKSEPEQLEIKETIRMPDDNRLRPSTCPGTITPIRVAHEFTLQVFYSIWGKDLQGKPLPEDGPGRMRKMTLTQQTLIMSCHCTAGILALPTYAESLIGSPPSTEHECDVCACGQPLNQLLEREIAADFMPSSSTNVDDEDDPERGRQGAKATYTAD